MSSEPKSPVEVLVLAPTLNDGPVAADLLRQWSVEARACVNMDDLCAGIVGGCGAVVLSEEAFTAHGLEALRATLALQEPWSDLPIILLSNADVARVAGLLDRAGNMALLERPFSKLTLVRFVEVALRARLRQYQVRDLLLQLKTAKDEADRANQAKSQFLANMSHEIRTPIGAIMGFLEIIRDTETGEAERSVYMRIIDRNVHQLMSLINDILDLSKVEAGKMSIEAVAFDLGEFLADFASNMSLRASEAAITFTMRLATPLPETITSDPVRLRQILANIVGNAIKFTPKGSIDLEVRFEAPCLFFRVRDTGIGLNIEQISKLFKPFSQADSSTTRKFGGTGLGLTLSRSLAEALGGHLTLLKSEPNVGSTFEISVRPGFTADVRWINESDLTLQPTRKTVPPAPTELHDRRLLVIDDSPDNQLLISTYLQATGAAIQLCSDGREGLSAAMGGNFDLVLMDVQMPVMDGHEATRELRRLGFTKPIIALTAHAMNEEKARCLASGFTDYLSKPIDRKRLVELIAEHTARR